MKKAVFITYNQALTERVAYLLDQLQIKGFTQWPLVNLKYVKALDEVNKENGIRAFVWDITNMY